MKKILVIEDNVELLENTAEILEMNGYLVHTASNGVDGFLKAAMYTPDVIISDMVMPLSGGLTLLKLIKEKEEMKNIPVIFFSAESAPASVKKGMELGADVYLRKPFTREELTEAVNQCLLIGKAKAG